MFKWLLILCFAVMGCCAYANTPAKPAAGQHKPYTLVYDTIKPNLRSFNSKALADYRQDPAFSYLEKANRHKNLWERFWDWFWDWINRLFAPRSIGGTSDGLRTVIIVAAVLLFLYAIIKYIGADIFKMFAKGDNKVDVPYQETLENIHEINFDDDIENALAQRNYKLAVRLLYLRSLKQLNDAGLINWQIEKTNSVYIDELTNADQRQTFGILTRQFEYVWYGNFPVDEHAFRNINLLFQDFKKILG